MVIQVYGDLEGFGGAVKSLSEGGEQGGLPWFGPGGGSRDQSVGGDEGLNPARVNVEPFFNERRGA